MCVKIAGGLGSGSSRSPAPGDPCPGICAGTAAALAPVIPVLEPVVWLRLLLPFPGMELAKVFPVPCSSPRLWSLWAARVPWQWRKEKLLVLELAWVAATPPAPAAWEQGSTAAAFLAPDKQPLFQAPGTEPSSLPAPCQLHAGQTLHASFRSPRSGRQRGDSRDTHRSHPVTATGARPCPVTGAGRQRPNRGSTGAANPAQFTGHCPRAHPYAEMQISLFSTLSKV